MAVLGLVRDEVADLAGIEDVRLALDEVLLGTVIVRGLGITVDVSSSPGEIVVEVRVAGTDLAVPAEIVRGLVDDIDVVDHGDATTVVLRRRWSNGTRPS